MPGRLPSRGAGQIIITSATEIKTIS